MITKSIELNIKDIDMSKREAVIAHATYKTLDGDQDRSNRGMFDKSWKENFNLLRFFLNHKKDQAPGKVMQTWDDSEQAYTRVKCGTHTLGDDVLKMLDEQTIVAASFGFDPIKYKDIKGKGKDFIEVKHYETSVLTHWGAHEKSGIISVEKAADFPEFNVKQLNEQEQGLLVRLIGNGMDSIQAAIEVAAGLDTESDLYTYIMYIISRQADQIGGLRSELRYGMKEKVEAQVAKMQKFIRNTTASDDAILLIQKSLKSLLNKSSDTAISTDTSYVKCPKCATKSLAMADELGCIKCAECNHVVKDGQPDASRNKDEVRRKMLLVKAQLAGHNNN
jgi:HK97 family phage prohead protease